MIIFTLENSHIIINFNFQNTTWNYFIITVTIATVFLAILTQLTENIHSSHQRSEQSFRINLIIGEIFYSVGAIFTQGYSAPPIRTPSRVFVACYWLYLISMVAAFTGSLVATMSVQKIKLPINTYQELLDHPTFEVGLQGKRSLMS